MTTLLALVSGLAVSTSFAQMDQPKTDRQNQYQNQPRTNQDHANRDRTMRDSERMSPALAFWSKLKGTNIYNNNNENIGEINDLIVTRGSGRISFATVTTGSVLGMGGKTILIPFDDLNYDRANERFTLNTTAENLKNLPEFSRDAWKNAGKRQGRDQAKNEQALAEALARAAALEQVDPYARDFGSLGQPTRLQGEVTRVERRTGPGGGENVYVTIRGQGGADQTILLGPSWYITGENLEPARSSQFSVNAVKVPSERNGGQEYVATDLTHDGTTYSLRNQANGQGVWMNEPKERDREGMWEGGVTGHYVLATQVNGKEVDCRGQKCGDVNDLVIDRANGAIAYLSIDPDQNFLGVADTKRLVPWTVTTVRWDGKVGIDATKDMVLASPKTPGDAQSLANEPDRVYKAYDTSAPTWRRDMDRDHDKMDRDKMDRNRRGDRDNMNDNANQGWTGDTAFGRMVANGTPTDVSGKVIRVERTSPWEGVSKGVCVTVKEDDGAMKKVFLGPESYKPASQFKEGDTVTIHTVKVNNGNQPEFYVARTAESQGQKFDYWSTPSPAWKNNR